MPGYLELTDDDKNAVLEQAAQELGRPARVLEKDLWVCWVLSRLFGNDFGCPLTFKGGTSLAKVYRVIQRFSEDVDVTVDNRPWGIDLGPELSKSKRKENFQQVHRRLIEFAQDSLLPALQLPDVGVEASLDTSPDVKILVKYPSVLQTGQALSYLREWVLVELGARNPTEPNEDHIVRADVAPYFPQVDFPLAQVSVLSAVRTFWEKATLIHGAISASSLEGGAERLCRHWYDLGQLANHPEWGPRALHQLDMLTMVAEDKERLFPGQKYDYPGARPGTLRLVPDSDALENLTRDYSNMIAAGMFYGDAPDISEVLQDLRDLEEQINSRQKPATL